MSLTGVSAMVRPVTLKIFSPFLNSSRFAQGVICIPIRPPSSFMISYILFLRFKITVSKQNMHAVKKLPLYCCFQHKAFCRKSKERNDIFLDIFIRLLSSICKTLCFFSAF